MAYDIDGRPGFCCFCCRCCNYFVYGSICKIPASTFLLQSMMIFLAIAQITGASIILKTQNNDFIYQVLENDINFIIMVIVCGILLFFTNVIGLLGAYFKNRTLVGVYGFLFFVTFIFSVVYLYLGWSDYAQVSASVNREFWLRAVQNNPKQTCEFEQDNYCAGFKSDDCTVNCNPANPYCRFLSCPGIINQNVSTEFQACAEFEEAHSSQGCEPIIESSVKRTSFAGTIFTTVALGLMTIANILLCCVSASK